MRFLELPIKALREFLAMARAGSDIRDYLRSNALKPLPSTDFSQVLRAVYARHGLAEVFEDEDQAGSANSYQFAEQIRDCLEIAETELKLARASAEEELKSLQAQQITSLSKRSGILAVLDSVNKSLANLEDLKHRKCG